MSTEMQVRDLYLKLDNGVSVKYECARVWDASRYLDWKRQDLQEEADKAGIIPPVLTVITKEEYNNARP